MPSENCISRNNSTNAILTSGSVFLGSFEDVTAYNTIVIKIASDVDSALLGVKLEFSHNGSDFDHIESFTHTGSTSYIKQEIKGVYFRLRYTNGGTNQTYMRCQVKFIEGIYTHAGDTIVSFDEASTDSFGRLRTSNPQTILSNNLILGKNPLNNYELITGSATSVYNINSSSVTLATTGGSVERCSRKRSIYQPGKSLLVMITGNLNSASNGSNVVTRIGHYDNLSGHYFQYTAGVLSIVERTSVSGSTVNTVVNQGSWNLDSNGYNIDASKNNIFWFNIQWLGTGSVNCGIIVDGVEITLHRFRHGNLLQTAYMQTASLPPFYEISSGGDSGSMECVCYTSISEGGFPPIGNLFSVNSGATDKTVNTTPQCLLALRVTSTANFSKITAIIKHIHVMCTSTANSLVEIFIFHDTADTAVLTGQSWVSANAESGVEYDISSTAFTATGGNLIDSYYISNKSDSIGQVAGDNDYLTSNPAGVSDLYCITVRSLTAQNEDYFCAVNWGEYI